MSPNAKKHGNGNSAPLLFDFGGDLEASVGVLFIGDALFMHKCLKRRQVFLFIFSPRMAALERHGRKEEKTSVSLQFDNTEGIIKINEDEVAKESICTGSRADGEESQADFVIGV